MILRAFLLTAVLFAAVTAPVRAADVSVDLSEPVVKITAGFHGTDLLIFGVAPGAGDIVVVVRGPQQTEVVRRKERVLGVWVNRDEVTFKDVPSFYLMAANRPLDMFLPADVAATHSIGLHNIDLKPAGDDRAEADWDPFRHALLRNKMRDGLYLENPVNLIFKNNRLFRSKIHFPANVPVGTYGIDVFQIRNGELVSNQTMLLSVRKFGVEARVFNLAHRHSAIYGILAVIIAVIAGWAANAAFRKA